MSLAGFHVCTGPWQVLPMAAHLDLTTLLPLLEQREPVTLSHNDIAFIGLDDLESRIDERYYACDITVPGIVVEGARNPYNKKYRMIDGSHRMAKMFLEHPELTRSKHYVITEKEFFDRLEIVMR